MQLHRHNERIKEERNSQDLQNLYFMVFLIFILFVISMETTLMSISFFRRGHPKACRCITPYPFIKSALHDRECDYKQSALHNEVGGGRVQL